MGKIRILDEDTISKISAGEVIDSPYSVVRELVDNSIDAGSTRIIVNVLEGGKKLIEVLDDGEGMDKEDLEKCYLRHSTSKIEKFDNIYSITTMGFRGEALASIAEVSELEIISKRRETNEGYKLSVKGGKFESLIPHPSKDGTTVKVKNLFFNMPPRREFLKSTTTEFKNILDIFIKKAIPLPQINFELYHNLKKELILPKTNSYLERIMSIFPEIKQLTYIKKTFEDMEIEILFSKPSVTRQTRNLQHIYVNSRFVESKTFLTAVSNAYSNLVPKGNFPIVFCFVKVDPSLIDVNIHPAKKEIKFKNEGKLFHYIISTIKEGLSESNQTLDIEESLKFNPIEQSIKSSLESFLKSKEKEYEIQKIKESKNQGNTLLTTLTPITTPENTYPPTSINKSEINQLQTRISQKYRFIGIAFKTYLIFEELGTDRLLILDQHASDERLTFSKLYKQIIENKSLSKQILISPITIEVSSICTNIVKEKIKTFEKLGFEIKIQDKLYIYTVPSFFSKNIDPTSSIIEICEKLQEGIEPSLENILEILSIISCRSSIKAGDIISPIEAYKLLEDVMSIEDKYSCPHGRPTMVYISKKTLEKIFSRK